MERELIDRRRWPWKSRKNFNGLSTGSADSASSPAPVKLFDEQEVARILQDQVRTADDQLVEALQAAEAKYSQREKALNLKIAAGNEKLTSALAEITIKDNLVKQHIKVAEEAVVGWEKAETEAAEYKAELEDTLQKRRETEEHAKHLDGALKELMQQLHCGREEHEKQLHQTIVKKTRDFDKVRLEMEAKLAEASKSLSDNRTHMIELKAENEAINHALQDRSRMIAELIDIRAHVESEIKILRVRFDGLEKENFDLKYKLHTVTKELEIRSAELEYGKKASDVMSRHHADSLKKIARLEDECNRLRMMVRKKLPNPAAIVRMKQELDSLAKEAGESATPRHRRRQSMLRSQSGGVEFLPIHELVVVDEAQDLQEANAERIANMDEETRMLKEALAKRNDELQSARLMCARTASRLTAVEDELEALKAASAESVYISRENSISKETPSVSSSSSSSSLPVSESISKRVPWRDGVPKLDPSKNSVEMEPFAHSRSYSEPRLGFKSFVHELAVENSSGISPQQQHIADLEKALAANYRDFQAANRTCEELRAQLSSTEKQFAALQARNAANEQSVIVLQDRLDKLLESQVTAEKYQTNSADAASPEASISQFQMEFATTAKCVIQATEALVRALEIHNVSAAEAEGAFAFEPIVMPIHWKESKLDSSMSSSSLAANKLQERESDVHSVLSFMSKLSSNLTCIAELSTLVIKDLRKDSEAVRLCLDSANAQIFQLQEITGKSQEDRVASEIQVEVELNRISDLERMVSQLQTEKAEALRQVSDVVTQLREAKEKVDALSDQLKEAEVLIASLRLQTDHQKQEDELIEEELLELSSSHPGLAKMCAADAEMNGLHSKLASLEVELLGERRRHHDFIAKLEDLQQQIHRGVGRVCPSRSLHSDEISEPFLSDEAGSNARQEREIAAAALAECQRTILALGKQLKILGFSESRELTVRATDSPESIKRMTETMELLRWHAESGDQGPPQMKKSSTAESIADGPVSVPASPARSDHLEAPSTPESPATSTLRRSVRTTRPFQLPKIPGTNCNGEVILSNANESVESSKTAATYTRFHARSPSESSLSSGHSNGN